MYSKKRPPQVRRKLTLMRLSALLIASPLLCPPVVGGAESDSCQTPVSGRYDNTQYNFAFTVPRGHTGRNPAACGIDEHAKCICWGVHGIVIDLGRNAAVVAYADYPTEIEDPTSEKILQSFIEGLHNYGNAGDAKLQSINKANLKGRPGSKISASYTQDDVALDMEYYLFFTGEARVSIALTAPRGQLSKYRSSLAEVLRTWAWTSTTSHFSEPHS
jgi:hypothetical protein